MRNDSARRRFRHVCSFFDSPFDSICLQFRSARNHSLLDEPVLHALQDDPQEDEFKRPVQACGEQVTDRAIKRRVNHSFSSP